MEHIRQLIEISRLFGSDPSFVIAGGGNTSYKNREHLWVKASGVALADITEEGFVRMSRPLLAKIGEKQYCSDPVTRENEVKNDLAAAVVSPGSIRPSVEASLHDVIDHAFVVHTHPTAVNGLMCSGNAAIATAELFGDDAIYVEYTDPGYTLFIKVRDRIQQYRERHGISPSMIFLQNHGLFVGGDFTDEITAIYESVMEKLTAGLSTSMPPEEIIELQSELQGMIGDHLQKKGRVTKAYRGKLIGHFTENRSSYRKIERPFTPDIIVYCKSKYIYLDKDLSPFDIIGKLETFNLEFGYYPKVILSETGEMIISDDNEKSVEIARDVFFDMMKISWLTENYGGPHFMTEEQITFIDNWEVENYRRKMAGQ
jgi:rhamnose utilization protein RhaD (predicted bifunctional aldolase and dehydrogenase)